MKKSSFRHIKKSKFEKSNKVEDKPSRPLTERTWFILVTFFLALIGTGKTVFDLQKETNKHPKFAFFQELILTNRIKLPDSDSYFTTMLIPGKIYNSGEEPLIIDGFELEFKKDGLRIPFHIGIIPPHLFDKVISEDSLTEMNFLNADQKDFNKIKRLEPSEVNYGYFWFLTKELDTSLFKGSLEAKIICHDINKKKYYSDNIYLDRGVPQMNRVANPKLDIGIYPVKKP